MSQPTRPNSPSYQQHSSHKAGRLYQQLLTNNYLHDHLYKPSQDQPASIKFINPANSNYPKQTNVIEQ